MARSSGIDVETRDAIVRVELRGPGGYAGLAGALRRTGDDPGVRALFIAGAWDCAPAGLPLAPDDDPVAALADLPFPTVGWIDGLCAEEGLELALAADLRVAHPDASFRMAHAAQGRMPTHGGSQRLARIAGPARAMHMLLTGDVLSAGDALRDGVAQAIGGRDDALGLARAAAGLAPIAARYAKEAVRAAADLSLADGLRLEADLSILLHSTHDRAEGLRSFIERRSPRFEGR